MFTLIQPVATMFYCGYQFMSHEYQHLYDDMLYKGKHSGSAVYLMDITSLKIISVSVENSTGYGIFAVNILGSSYVSHSRFIFNNYYTLSSTNCSNGLGSCEGGNMRLQ